MTTLILARHGMTEWNLAGRFQGHADSPLTPAGWEQAHALAKQLAERGVEAIYSSNLKRACDTAQIVGDRLGLLVKVDPRLREVGQGAWEGMLRADIVAQYPAVWAEREREPLHNRPPSGESVAEVAARAWEAADDIARSHPIGPVLVVSHGLTLATLICRAQGRPLAEAIRHIPENAVPLWVDWTAGAD